MADPEDDIPTPVTPATIPGRPSSISAQKERLKKTLREYVRDIQHPDFGEDEEEEISELVERNLLRAGEAVQKVSEIADEVAEKTYDAVKERLSQPPPPEKKE